MKKCLIAQLCLGRHPVPAHHHKVYGLLPHTITSDINIEEEMLRNLNKIDEEHPGFDALAVYTTGHLEARMTLRRLCSKFQISMVEVEYYPDREGEEKEKVVEGNKYVDTCYSDNEGNWWVE